MIRKALPLSRNYFSISIALRASSRPPIAGRPSKRFFADPRNKDPNTKPSIHDSDAAVLPGSQSTTKTAPTPPAPGPIASVSPATPSPPTPSENRTIAPENVPLVPPPPLKVKVQTSPPTSIPRATSPAANSIPPSPPPKAKVQTSSPTPAANSISPPPPPSGKSEPTSSPPPTAPRRRGGRFRRFFLYLVLLGGLSYAGGVYYSLVSDNFHDFFTEYIPFGEDAVLYFEEREYRKRFPRMTNPSNRPVPDLGNKITIPSRSGVSWKMSEEGDKESNGTKGPQACTINDQKSKSAIEAQQTSPRATQSEKTKVVKKVKKDASSTPSTPTSEKAKIDAPPPATEPEKPPPRSTPISSENFTDQSVRGPQVDEPSVPKIVPITRIDPINIKSAEEPLVQDLVKILNDIITVVNADNASGRYSSTIGKAKSELVNVGQKIIALKEAERQLAEETIKSTERDFDNAAKELVRRLEEEMKLQESRWRDEFESEREKIAQSYQERLESETKRSQQISEQRLRNELLEQAIELKNKFISEVKDRVETERNGRLSKLSDLSASISELESLTSQWNSVLDTNLKTQHLQVAVEAVRASLDHADRPRPFVYELAALKELAADNPVVNAAIASINPTAYQRGVSTSAELIDRFRRVAAEVRKAALLPEDAEDAGIAAHAASNVLSRLLFKKTKGRAAVESGADDDDDVESVLTRTETLLEEGNLDAAAREMNRLEGWAKRLSSDWIAEARRVLEVRQALEVVAAEVRLQALGVD